MVQVMAMVSRSGPAEKYTKVCGAMTQEMVLVNKHGLQVKYMKDRGKMINVVVMESFSGPMASSTSVSGRME